MARSCGRTRGVHVAGGCGAGGRLGRGICCLCSILVVFVCRGCVGFVCRRPYLHYSVQSLSGSRVRCAHASGGCRRIRRGHALTARHAHVGHASDTARLGPPGVLCGAWPSERSFVRVGAGGSGLGRPRVCSADVGSWRFRRWYGAVGGCSRRGSRPSWWSAAAVARCGGVCVGKLVVCELWGWGRGGLACAQQTSAVGDFGGDSEPAAGVRGGVGGSRGGRRLRRL